MADKHLEQIESSIWPQASKKPVLVVPEFVNSWWLKPKIATSEKSRENIQKIGYQIQKLSGFRWPSWDGLPSEQLFLDTVLDGMKYPVFIRGLSVLTALAHQDEDFRYASTIFNPFWKAVTRKLEVEDDIESFDSSLENMLLLSQRLLDSNNLEMSRDALFISCVIHGFHIEHMFMYKKLGDKGLETFLRLCSKYFRYQDFNWQNDKNVQIRRTLDKEGAEMRNPQRIKVISAKEEWRHALEVIRESVDTAMDEEPSEHVLNDIKSALDLAEEAYKKWLEAQPKYIDAGPIISRISKLKERIEEGYTDRVVNLDSIRGIMYLSPDVAEQVDMREGEIDDQIERWEEANKEFLEILDGQRNSLLQKEKRMQRERWYAENYNKKREARDNIGLEIYESVINLIQYVSENRIRSHIS